MITPYHYLGLAAILFTIGLTGLMIRRNVILILLSIELMLNAANLVFVTGASMHGQTDGQVMAFLVMAPLVMRSKSADSWRGYCSTTPGSLMAFAIALSLALQQPLRRPTSTAIASAAGRWRPGSPAPRPAAR